MKFPWQKRHEDACAETQRAKTEYEWAVQQRTTVQAVVKSVLTRAEQNNIIENLQLVIRGGGK